MDLNIPNRLYGDYYCEICDSHMNSEGVWETHVTGKRHIKNIKKGGGDFKYEDLDVESSVKHELRKVKDPIVGLSYIHELRRKEAGIPSLYTCFLCQATFASVPMVIEHVITLKHRLNYMKENSPDDYELLNSIHLKEREMEPLVEEMTRKQEQKYGTGSVKVRQERSKQRSYAPPKRTFDSDDDDMPRKTIKFDRNRYVSKAVDCRKKANRKAVRDCREIIEERRKRAYSSDEESDMYKQDYYPKQPFHDNRPGSYRSSTPSSRESSKREAIYSRSRTQASSKERFSRTRIQASPEEHCSQCRSCKTQEKDLKESSKKSPLPSETEVQQPLSTSQVLKDCVQIAYSLPTEIFLNVALMKLENIEVDDLGLLSEVVNKAQAVLRSKSPPDVQAVPKQSMSQKSENNIQKIFSSSSVTTEGNASSSFNAETNFKSPESDFDEIKVCLKDILNHAKENVDSIPSVSQNVTPHEVPQRSSSYPGSFYGNISHNSAVAGSSSIPILTLTDESGDST